MSDTIKKRLKIETAFTLIDEYEFDTDKWEKDRHNVANVIRDDMFEPADYGCLTKLIVTDLDTGEVFTCT